MMSLRWWCHRPGRVQHVWVWALLAVVLCVPLGFALYVYVLYFYVWEPKQDFCMEDAWYALRAHGAEVGPFPRDKLGPTGQPILSWRRICADGDSGPRLGDRNAPWNAPSNAMAAKGGCLTFCFFRPPWIIDQLFPGYYPQTRVLAISGPDTAFDPGRETALRDLPPNLILLVEVWGTGINWLEPGDIDVRDWRYLRMGGRHGRGCWLLFADGILAFVRSDVPLENVKRFCTITSAKKSNREELLGPYIVEARNLKREDYKLERPLIP